MTLMLLLKPSWKTYFQPSDRYRENLDLLSVNYDNIFLLHDFNTEVKIDYLKGFCDLYGVKRLINSFMAEVSVT